MNTDIDDLMRKTKTYWYEDGLVEILAGLFFVVIGLFLLADWATPQDSPLKWIFAPGFAVVTIAWILSGRKVVNWFKEKITYPRTGYVSYKTARSASRVARGLLGGLIGAAVSLAIVASLMYRQDIVRVIPLIMGAGVALLIVRIGSELGLVRFYIAAVWSVLIGGLLAWWTADMSLSIALYYVLLGPAILAGGVVTLMRYLRASAEEANDA
jgi:hypothetical protein